MSNRQLTNQEMLKIFRLYEEYGAKRLTDFIQMIWEEAYDLGVNDTYKGNKPIYPAEVKIETTSP